MAILSACLLFLSGIADLDELAKRRDIQWSCEAATGRHTIRCGPSTIVFAPGFQTALVNGMPLPLSAPATLEGGRVKLPPELVRYVESAPLRRPDAAIAARPKPAPPAPPIRSSGRWPESASRSIRATAACTPAGRAVRACSKKTSTSRSRCTWRRSWSPGAPAS